ncbi:MAG: hypothetical protein IPJ49_20615 [Candidatus Obscuribacter sp.]|nr:hypothetical protein [Candidatus Obscuribacter sp.]
MSSIIALQNGHQKVVRNRYSNNYKHFGSFFRRQQNTQNVCTLSKFC